MFLAILAMGMMVGACSSDNQATTGEAEKVEVVTTNETVTLGTVKEGSAVAWRAAHLGGVQPRNGRVFLQSAEVLVEGGSVKNATVVMDMKAVTVENFPEGAPEIAKLTQHLLSADFFNTDQYPTAKFELTKIEANEGGDYNSKVTGNLTILDVAKSVTFNANVTASDSEVAIKSEDFSVDRTNWGLSYNTEGTAGVPVDYLIANDIGFTIDVTVTK